MKQTTSPPTEPRSILEGRYILSLIQAKVKGTIHFPAESKLAFIIRIRGINKLNPKVVRIMRLLRLRQLHNGTFVRLNKASVNMIRRVLPFVTYGVPSREMIKKLIYKRGFGKIAGQRVALTNNKIIEDTLEFSEVDICVGVDLNAITVLCFQSIENFHDVYVILVSAI